MVVLLALAALVVQSPESRCAAVASWRLPDTKIAAAQFVFHHCFHHPRRTNSLANMKPRNTN